MASVTESAIESVGQADVPEDHVTRARCVLVGNRVDLDEAIEFFRRGQIKVPYQVVELSKLNDVLQALDHSEVIGRYVVDTSG